MILSGSVPTLGNLLSPIYFQFFLDKLASSLGPRFYLNVFKCKTGAQQMLLDTQAVKTILLDIPSLRRQATRAVGYAKFVSREMRKAEDLLKVLLSPIDSVADTYGALLPEGTPSEFQRILELKSIKVCSIDYQFIAHGLKKADQQTILDDFNKRGSDMSESPVATHTVQIPYFVEPSHDCVVECLLTCQSEQNPPKFSPIKCETYLLQRYQDTHADLSAYCKINPNHNRNKRRV